MIVGIKRLLDDLRVTADKYLNSVPQTRRMTKKLEKKGGSRTHKLKRLYKVGRSGRVISSDEASLGDQEDASKQGKKIDDIDKDAEITLVHETRGRYGDGEMFNTGVLDGDEEKANVVEEPSESITTTPTLTTTTAATIITATSTRPRLQAKFDEQERIEREKAEANIALKETWDDIHAKIEKRRKHFTSKRAEEKRNRPPTKAQQRSVMCTYLKNIEGWKPKDLKSNSFVNNQELFDKAMKRVNTFVDYKTKLVEGSLKKADAKIA
ncbi:hypothetical protein Tco_1033799 [Tanacetum coccineum]